jgi:hypothetical protein
MINSSDIIIIENINDYAKAGKKIETIIENTVNTWQETRTKISKESDTKLGKLAEDIFQAYVKQNIKHITYLSYDDIRTNNFKKHAPFDGLLFNNENINIDNLREIIKEINSEITANKWGKISDKLKLKCLKQHIFITEIKSTRITDRHKNNGAVSLEALLKDDFLEYPKYLRKDSFNSINNYEDYIEFCKKYRNFNCKSGNCLDDIKKEELLNMRHLYIRIYIDEKELVAYIIGCISNRTFIKNSKIKKMPQRGKSEFALYLATSLKNGVNINKIDKIK